MATWDHITGLEGVIAEAHSIMSRVYGLIEKKEGRELNEKDAEQIVEAFVGQFSGDAGMLSKEAFSQKVENVVNLTLIEGKIPMLAGMNHLFGLAIALKIKPIPAAGRGFFFGEGIAET